MIASIRSGGQSGVDRAALDAAIARGVPYGGWCPAGGLAEDFTVPPGLLAEYPLLTPTPSANPEQRTAWNVRDGDATLVLTCGDIASASPGMLLTIRIAEESGKPCLVVPVFGDLACESIAAFLASLGSRQIELNVAGPRESQCPGIYSRARDVLVAAGGIVSL